MWHLNHLHDNKANSLKITVRWRSRGKARKDCHSQKHLLDCFNLPLSPRSHLYFITCCMNKVFTNLTCSAKGRWRGEVPVQTMYVCMSVCACVCLVTELCVFLLHVLKQRGERSPDVSCLLQRQMFWMDLWLFVQNRDASRKLLA